MNRALRAEVCSVLREAEFRKVEARKAWRWHEKTVCVFNIRSVGKYFSEVTGWPPGSLVVSIGVYFPFMADGLVPKVDDDDRIIPAEHECQIRSNLECALDQTEALKVLSNPAERRRKDLWWVEADGRNADPIARDVARALRDVGLPWFTRQTDLSNALAEVERGHDCFSKFDKAAFLAREIGDGERQRSYALRAEAEGIRIKRGIDRLARYGI